VDRKYPFCHAEDMTIAPREDIDWAGIRAAAVVIGVREAARQAASNLTEEEQERFVFRVLKRSQREKWILPDMHRPASCAPKATPLSSTVLTGSETLEKHMADCDAQSKMGYATVSSKLSSAFAQMKPEQLIACTPAVKDGVAIADKTFGWTRVTTGATMIQVNVGRSAPTE
jgi:hypothetical protein